MTPGFDERAHAGREHLDPAYIATYDDKSGFEVEPELALLRELGLGPQTTLVDFGAGTGLLAAAAVPYCKRVIAVDPSPTMLGRIRERDARVKTVEAGFLGYEHAGDAPQIIYSRNALHHLPDFWKAIALRRVAGMLAPGGTFVLRDIVYSFTPEEADDVLEAWFASASSDPAKGWTRSELEAHVRTEYSTFARLLEPMLERADFEIRDVWRSESRVYARYVCVKPPLRHT
ncbi:MAG TPA: class I SAM-dependent methyltransferase [Gaiellaceae bacterium]|nr:class I SAM-dependent methyltransferase [Gaiellaceae bacterium]